MQNFKFFGAVTCRAELDELHRRLAKRLHPDSGHADANAGAFADMKAEHAAVVSMMNYGAWPLPQAQTHVQPQVVYVVQQPQPTALERALRVVELIPPQTRAAIIESLAAGLVEGLADMMSETKHTDEGNRPE